MAKKPYMIPFDAAGNQMDYPYGHNMSTRENFEFEDTLTFVAAGRGRSSVTFYFKRKSTGTNVTMFLTDFTDIVAKLENGAITGRFTFCKRGQNYGCKYVGPVEKPAARIIEGEEEVE